MIGTQTCTSNSTFGACQCPSTDAGLRDGATPADAGPDGFPAVAITSPGDGAVVSSTIAIEVTASDDRAVSVVEVMLGRVSLGVLRAAPRRLVWDTRTVLDGIYTLWARATDDAGQQAAASVEITVSNATSATDAPPAVRIFYPLGEATLCGTISIQATATDDIGVASVAFFTDGRPLGTDAAAPYEIEWDTTVDTDGTHEVQAVATDTAGAQSQHSLQVGVANAGAVCDNPPSVRITAPTAPWISADEVEIRATASDDGGVLRLQCVDRERAAVRRDQHARSRGPHAGPDVLLPGRRRFPSRSRAAVE